MPMQFSLSKTWTTAAGPPVQRIADALKASNSLAQEGEPNGGETVLRGGSQLRTRLLGGWFISPQHLPKRVRLSSAQEADGSSRLTVVVEDALGAIAVRDRFFARRYEMAADEVFSTVERELGRATG